jgi:hypothetical protein
MGRTKPIVLIGNKSDLNEQRCIPYEVGKKQADEWKAGFLETSAKIGYVSGFFSFNVLKQHCKKLFCFFFRSKFRM